jgi:hypothetical protein
MRFMLILPLLGLAGCALPSAVQEESNEVPIPDGQGQLVLQWKQEEGRAVLGSSWAAASADAFDLVMLGAAGNRYAALDTSAVQSIGVEPGVYRVYVLAGVKRSSGSAAAEFVGAARADDVVIELGKRTRLDLTLKSIDLSWDTPGPAYFSSPLSVGLAGKSRTAGVGMSLAGTSTTQRPRFKSVELWNGYRDCSAVTGTPDDWRAEAAATVPSSGSTAAIGLIGAVLTLRGLDDEWFSPAGQTGFSWTWPNRADLADTHPLAPFVQLIVPLSAPVTGADVALTWE